MTKQVLKKIIQAIFITFILVAVGSVSNHSVKADHVSDFKAKMVTPVKNAASRYQVWPSVMMAQAALESSWGQSDLTLQANNYFGIKGTYNGASVTMRTAEYDANGKLYYTNAQFKKYPSAEQSMNDNGNTLRNGVSWDPTYYAGTWRERAASYQAAANALTGKYATDPAYGTKLISVINTNGFHALVDGGYTAKYIVGQTVQIASFAGTETNGTSLTNRRGWIGTIKKVTAKNHASSHFQYYVQYKAGKTTVSNWYVAEQDIQTPAAPKYQVGQTVQVASNALAETNGSSLVKFRNFSATVKKVQADNHSSSHYSYYLAYKNGKTSASSWYVPEQDIRVATARFGVGANVQVTGSATTETNGTSISSRRGWIGTVKKVSTNNFAASRFEYYVEYTNGTQTVSNWYVPEQALTTPQAPKDVAGKVVQITNNALKETNGTTLIPKRGKMGVVQKVAPNNFNVSHYEYRVNYTDGTSSWYVPEEAIK
ncbi:MAG: glucosaminidase domain-containing protein [Lactobacillaceae bacterium]|jgi:hypothetical protein|nr:glucosaminidase domain-containing protein [Lactobacillaceae bacterium]